MNLLEDYKELDKSCVVLKKSFGFTLNFLLPSREQMLVEHFGFMFEYNPIGIHFVLSQQLLHQSQIQIELGKVLFGCKS